MTIQEPLKIAPMELAELYAVTARLQSKTAKSGPSMSRALHDRVLRGMWPESPRGGQPSVFLKILRLDDVADRVPFMVSRLLKVRNEGTAFEILLDGCLSPPSPLPVLETTCNCIRCMGRLIRGSALRVSLQPSSDELDIAELVHRHGW